MRVIVVDDHLAVAEAFALALARRHTVVEVLCDGEALLPWLQLHEVDAILVDTTLPHCDIRELIRHVRRTYPSITVIAMSIHDDHGDWPNLHRWGAHGVVSKTRPLFDVRLTLEILRARGSPFDDRQQEVLHPALTTRQIDVLSAIASDKLHKEIALDLGLSEARVDEHISELKKRLGVRTLAGLVLRAVEEGWIEPRVAPPVDPHFELHSHRPRLGP
jgi:two-component system nitrate/nitrite response regulator NarL